MTGLQFKSSSEQYSKRALCSFKAIVVFCGEFFSEYYATYYNVKGGTST